MTRRKREITGLANERDFPHLVELALPPGGFRSTFLEFDAFHRERRIPVRRGRSRHEGEQLYIRFCFPHTATADAFRNRFGGECLTYAPESPKAPRTSRAQSPRHPLRCCRWDHSTIAPPWGVAGIRQKRSINVAGSPVGTPWRTARQRTATRRARGRDGSIRQELAEKINVARATYHAGCRWKDAGH
jgi:hypothetical protein